MSLPKELVERIVAWRPDDKGNCWDGCKAFSKEEALCECLGAVVKPGAPCPVYRLRVGLGRERDPR